MATASEPLDFPSHRGYEWEKRSKELKEEQGWVCEGCGRHNHDRRGSPICFDSHHIVKGKHLPISTARSDINLVVLCTRCHGGLENRRAAQQFRAVGRGGMATVLGLLACGGTVTPEDIVQKTGMGIFDAYGRLAASERLRLARRRSGCRYEAAPEQLPYDAIVLREDAECCWSNCDSPATRQEWEKRRGIWTLCCDEHSHIGCEREIGLMEVPDQ